MRVTLATVLGVLVARMIYNPSVPGHSWANFAAGAAMWCILVNVAALLVSIMYFER